MSSFSFFLSGKLFTCPSILNDSFAGWSNLGFFLLFMTLNISFQCLRGCSVSFENQLTVLWELLCRLLSLAAFKILSLSLTFGILIMVCLVVGLIASCCLGLSVLSGLAYLFPLPNYATFLSSFFQIDFQFLALSLLLLAPQCCECWNA